MDLPSDPRPDPPLDPPFPGGVERDAEWLVPLTLTLACPFAPFVLSTLASERGCR